jgi:hypothetical protein
VIAERGAPMRMVLGRSKMIAGWEEHLPTMLKGETTMVLTTHLSFLKCFWNIHLSLLPLELGELKYACSIIVHNYWNVITMVIVRK